MLPGSYLPEVREGRTQLGLLNEGLVEVGRLGDGEPTQETGAR